MVIAGVTAMLALALGTGGAAAQPAAAGAAALMLAAFAGAPPSAAGAFDALSAGNQKFARALYEAQKPASPAAHPALTLDQIGARRQSGLGWGEIFNGMKSQRLVREKTFAQVVSNHERRGKDGQPKGGG
jgi:hypothetical protein